MQEWQNLLNRFEQELGKETVEAWLRPLKVVRFDARNLYLETQDPLHVTWFEEQIRPRVDKRFVNTNHRPIQIHLALNRLTQDTPKAAARKPAKQEAQTPFTLTFDHIEPDATLETFLPASVEQAAWPLLQELCRQGASPFNPLLLFGESAVGKTHLMMAIASAGLQQGKKVGYVRCDSFVRHVVHAIRLGAMTKLRETYRTLDILLLDDADRLSNRFATQEELFHTFNSLFEQRKQIVLSAQKAPHLLTGIEPRLISRFEWGLVLPLHQLDSKRLRQILERRLHALHLELTESAIDFLCHEFANPKTLYMALDALKLRLHLQGDESRNLRTHDLHIVRTLLHDLTQQVQEQKRSPEKILSEVAKLFGVRQEEILGSSQKRECALPRQLAMYLCRTELRTPFTRLGKIFSRDHSTVISSVRQIQAKIASRDPELLALLAQLRS